MIESRIKDLEKCRDEILSVLEKYNADIRAEFGYDIDIKDRNSGLFLELFE